MTVLGAQTPTIENVPPYVSSAGGEAIELAERAGLYLDEWQRHVLERALGERADGKWSAPTVGLVVGRQNGKNSILEARELAGVFLFGEKVVVHSAHEQATSSEHFRRILDLIEGVPEFDRRILKVVRGKGAEAIELRGGYRILFKTRTGGGGRGFSGDLIVFDEAMILSADAKAALIPTMAAKSVEGNPQTWYAASAVDQQNPKHDGVELARVRRQGMEGHPRVAYFEWSVPPWSDDPRDYNPSQVPKEIASDPARQALANPGLGIRISPEWVEHERTVELGAREFAVERLGVGDWPDPDLVNTKIDLETWKTLIDPVSVLGDPVCFAFDVTPDRSGGSIGAAGTRPDGLPHIETVDCRRGTGWMVDRIVELLGRHPSMGLACDGAGPAASLIPELESRKVEVHAVSAREHGQACGMLYDRVDQQTLRHLGQAELTVAIRGAATRPLGDAWAWARRSSTVDISPLVAVTLALWGFETRMGQGAPVPKVIDLSTV